MLWEIWGAHGDDYKEYCLLGNDTTLSGGSLPTFGGYTASIFRVEENTLHSSNISNDWPDYIVLHPRRQQYSSTHYPVVIK
jgi:hypothetical protein